MTLLKPYEVEAFQEILEKHGWRFKDFRIQEEVLDPVSPRSRQNSGK